MRKIGLKLLAPLAASAALMAAGPANAGYDVIYYGDDGTTIVGYELWCGGSVVLAYGIHPTPIFSWFYNPSCY